MSVLLVALFLCLQQEVGIMAEVNEKTQMYKGVGRVLPGGRLLPSRKERVVRNVPLPITRTTPLGACL